MKQFGLPLHQGDQFIRHTGIILEIVGRGPGRFLDLTELQSSVATGALEWTAQTKPGFRITLPHQFDSRVEGFGRQRAGVVLGVADRLFDTRDRLRQILGARIGGRPKRIGLGQLRVTKVTKVTIVWKVSRVMGV